MWAEAFINGGYIALVIVFVAIGYALARMDAILKRQLSSGGVWAIAGAIYPVYMTILLRGSLLQATGAVVVSLGFILFLRSRQPPDPDRHGTARSTAASRQPGAGRTPAVLPGVERLQLTSDRLHGHLLAHVRTTSLTHLVGGDRVSQQCAQRLDQRVGASRRPRALHRSRGPGLPARRSG